MILGNLVIILGQLTRNFAISLYWRELQFLQNAQNSLADAANIATTMVESVEALRTEAGFDALVKVGIDLGKEEELPNH